MEFASFHKKQPRLPPQRVQKKNKHHSITLKPHSMHAMSSKISKNQPQPAYPLKTKLIISKTTIVCENKNNIFNE